MDILRKVLNVVYGAFFLTMAVGSFLAVFTEASNHGLAQLVGEITVGIYRGGPYTRGLFFLVTCFFIFIGLSFLYRALFFRDRSRVITVKQGEGEMAVRLNALEDHLATYKDEIPEVKEIKPVLRMGKKGVQLDAKVVIWSEGNLPQIAGKVQTVLAAALKEALSLEEEIKPRVVVAKILRKRVGPPGGTITIKK
jgi:apolipoprotein N-acyltransferase